MAALNYAFVVCVGLTTVVNGLDINQRALMDKCKYDKDCKMENAFCKQDISTCLCMEGYEPNKEKSKCIITLGATCSGTYDCATLENTECRNSICACRDTHVAHPSRSQCLPGSALQGFCEETVQCYLIAGNNTHCTNATCQCTGYHHVALNKCIKSQGYGDPCSDKNECYFGPQNTNQVECVEGRCACAEGFHVTEENICGGANQLLVSTVALIGLFAFTKVII